MSGRGGTLGSGLDADLEALRAFVAIGPDDAEGRAVFRSYHCPACRGRGPGAEGLCRSLGCGLHERRHFLVEQRWVAETWGSLLPPARANPETMDLFQAHLTVDPCLTVAFVPDDEGLYTLVPAPARHLRGYIQAALVRMVQIVVGDSLRINLDSRMATDKIRDRISKLRQMREGWRQADLAHRKATGASILQLAEEEGVSRPKIRRHLDDREGRIKRRPGRR